MLSVIACLAIILSSSCPGDLIVAEANVTGPPIIAVATISYSDVRDDSFTISSPECVATLCYAESDPCNFAVVSSLDLPAVYADWWEKQWLDEETGEWHTETNNLLAGHLVVAIKADGTIGRGIQLNDGRVFDPATAELWSRLR